jgi:hypothetical protein
MNTLAWILCQWYILVCMKSLQHRTCNSKWCNHLCFQQLQTMLQHTPVPVTPPAYVLHSQSIWSKFRDIVNTIAAIGGIAYGLYWLYKVHFSCHIQIYHFINRDKQQQHQCWYHCIFAHFVSVLYAQWTLVICMNQILTQVSVLSEICRTILIWYKR